VPSAITDRDGQVALIGRSGGCSSGSVAAHERLSVPETGI
jgi:hypothetical protein